MVFVKYRFVFKVFALFSTRTKRLLIKAVWLFWFTTLFFNKTRRFFIKAIWFLWFTTLFFNKTRRFFIFTRSFFSISASTRFVFQSPLLPAFLPLQAGSCSLFLICGFLLFFRQFFLVFAGVLMGF